MTIGNGLTLSFDRAIVCGVSSGISQSLGWNPLFVRMLFVLLSLASGIVPGVILYLVLYLLIPSPKRACNTD
jgi:phage shock protein C